jgi:hypothetical protein
MNAEQTTSAEPTLNNENCQLTWKLFEKITAYYAVPRLRQRLVRIEFKEVESWIPLSRERDLVYLVSALRDFQDYSKSENLLSDIGPLLGEYLRSLESFGIAIQQFLTRSAKSWDEIRPKYQELSRVYLSKTLSRFFPGLPQYRTDFIAAYLLTNTLSRVLPTFPFHKEKEIFPLMLLRVKSDLAWTRLNSRLDLAGPLNFHFPEIDWRENSFEDRNVWYLGARLLSQLTVKTGDVIQRALDNLNHQSSSLVKNKKRFLHLAFYSESDLSLFKFNLSHYARIAGVYYELFPSTGPEFREGYPGMSGFIEEEYRADAASCVRP